MVGEGQVTALPAPSRSCSAVTNASASRPVSRASSQFAGAGLKTLPTQLPQPPLKHIHVPFTTGQLKVLLVNWPTYFAEQAGRMSGANARLSRDQEPTASQFNDVVIDLVSL